MIQSTLRIFKYQALGNTYMILDPQYQLSDRFLEPSNCGVSRPRTQLVQSLCDASAGVGSNGLLFGPLPTLGKDHFRMLIINSDGTSAGFSGNGTRIFAKYLMDSKTVRPGALIELEIPDEITSSTVRWNNVRIQLPMTSDGPIEVTAPHAPRFGIEFVSGDPKMCIPLRPMDHSTSIPTYKVLPLSSLGPDEVSDAPPFSVLLDIGNPHCVTFVSKPQQMPTLEFLRNDENLKEIAFRSERSTPLFAHGANLQWVWPARRKLLLLTIYERGEGPTPASGSSACAAACAAFGLGLIDNDVEVAMPGGSLAVRLEGTRTEISRVTLIGDAHRILDGIVSIA